MSYPKPILTAAEGRTVKIAHPILPDAPKTVLSASVSATGTTLTVLDNTGFANAEWLVVGKPGEERAEALRVNGAVTRGTSLTVTAATFDHPKDAPVTRALFDQWRIYGNSTDTTVAATLIATVDVKWDEPETVYVNSGTEYNYYFAVGYDSNAASEFTFSDGIAKDTGWAEGTVGKIVEDCFRDTGFEREKFTRDQLFTEVNDCLRDITGKLRRWSFLQVFDYSLAGIVRGTFKADLPSDIEDQESARSILGLRIGSGPDLDYLDKEEWEKELDGVVYTEVTTQATAGDTTLEIDNSYDFADSGSVDVFVSGVKYTLTYTGVTRSQTAGILTGIPASGTGAITVTVPVDSGVWQNVEEGEPKNYTVMDGEVRFWPLADSAHDYSNVFLDYVSKKTSVDQYSDTVDGQRYDAVKSWLKWKMRASNRAGGEPDLQDADYIRYQVILGDLIRNEDTGQKGQFRYKTQGIKY